MIFVSHLFVKPLECYILFMYNKMEILCSGVTGVNYAITRLAWRYPARDALHDAVALNKALYRPLPRKAGYGIDRSDGRIGSYRRVYNLLLL